MSPYTEQRITIEFRLNGQTSTRRAMAKGGWPRRRLT